MENTTVNYADSVSGIFDIASDALTMITGNPVLLTFFVVGLVFTGIAVIKSLKK